jgi:hypothetical protein
MAISERTLYQLGLEGLQLFNEAPSYLCGQVSATERDGIRISGHAVRQSIGWYNIGARSEALEPHSFAFSADAKPYCALGAYSIGVQAVGSGLSLNISHFLRNSVSIPEPQIIENVLSGWGYDSLGQRSQSGVVNSEVALNRIHRLELRYEAGDHHLSAAANGSQVHSVFGSLEQFRLLIRFQAVAVEGDFDVELMNLSYLSLDAGGLSNMRTLRAWNPQYAPVFISYAHADSERVSRIVDDLRASGVRVLGDWDFKTGDSLLGRIRQEICGARFLIVALSRASIASEWVNRELRLALEGEGASRGVKVLPALTEDCTIPDFLDDIVRADFRREDSGGLQDVLEVIRTAGSW